MHKDTEYSSFQLAHQAGTAQTPADNSLCNSVHKREVANGSINQHKTPSTHPTTASFRQERETATPGDCHIAPHISETGSAGGPRVEQLCSSRTPAISTHLSEKYEVVEFKSLITPSLNDSSPTCVSPSSMQYPPHFALCEVICYIDLDSSFLYATAGDSRSMLKRLDRIQSS